MPEKCNPCFRLQQSIQFSHESALVKRWCRRKLSALRSRRGGKISSIWSDACISADAKSSKRMHHKRVKSCCISTNLNGVQQDIWWCYVCTTLPVCYPVFFFHKIVCWHERGAHFTHQVLLTVNPVGWLLTSDPTRRSLLLLIYTDK